MGPAKKPENYPNIKGTREEVIKYADQFRHDVLMEAKHALDRVQRLINVCQKMDEFLNVHMIANVKKRKIKERKKDKLKKTIKKHKKMWRRAKDKSEKKRIKLELKKYRVRLEKLEKRIREHT